VRALLRPVGWTLTVLLLLAGAALTVARLWQPATGPLAEPFVQLVALAPLAMPAYALALLAGVLVGRRSRAALVVAAVALAGLVTHLAWFAPYLHDDAPAAGDGTRLRVVTVNAYVHGGTTGPQLVGLARSTRADVVVVEELRPQAYADALAAGLDGLLPHRVGGTEYGATMVWSRLPLRDVQQLPDRTGGGSVRATLALDGRPLQLVGVHTAPPIWPRPWRADHERLLRLVQRDRPDVMAGDFNATPDHVQLRRLLGEGLRDGADLAGTGWAPTWPANGVQRVLGVGVPRFAAIDHVLVAPGWTVTAVRRVDVPRTDHTAVLAVVARSAR
jgi:endonuclease/exonuclease/phosphatase (EEP) superfamily protein YafD